MTDFIDRIKLETITLGRLSCEACGTVLEQRMRRAVTDEESIAHDRQFIPRAIQKQAFIDGWNFIEDERGLYVVCPRCHRKPRMS